MTPLLPVIVAVVIVFLVLIAVIVSQSFMNERLKKEIKSEEDSHAKSRKEHSEKVKSLSETIVQVMDTNKQLNDCNNEIITLMEQHTPAMEGLIKDNANLLAAQERLVECIRKTGIRDNKGVTRKAVEEQIDCLLLGFEMVSEPSKPTRDWNVPQAFPKRYKLKRGVTIKAVSVEVGIQRIKVGSNVTLRGDNSSMPYIRVHNPSDILVDYTMVCGYMNEFAPVNPTDHPEHPEFNNKKA